MSSEEQLVSDVWSVIHMIEERVGKDGLFEMSRVDLARLVMDVYDKLGSIVM